MKNYDSQFKSPSSKKLSRGTGFGSGVKTDFTQETKKYPGVGEYKLPTIWDKY